MNDLMTMSFRSKAPSGISRFSKATFGPMVMSTWIEITWMRIWTTMRGLYPRMKI